MGIKSQKDKPLLALAKEAVYKEGFYHGTMLVGTYAGKPVQEAKPLIRTELIKDGLAFAYCEPDGLVISRSGDECIVTLADQWFMDYGEESWKKQALECLAEMNTYHKEIRNGFEKNLDWLGQWACSRRFGLGSRVPWDDQWLIESLSDSTVYMAYYTVAHLLQGTKFICSAYSVGGSLDGSKVGPLGIKAEDLTDDVWEYILSSTAPLPKDSKIPVSALDKLRGEFNYFYPMDLRCSGKDLVTNHLTFSIYNHVALFPKDHWPLAIRANGHLLLNNDKMSKSTGNFLTLRQAIEKYGADAVRFTLADAGDSIDDANFLEKTADTAILRLFTEKEWMADTLEKSSTLRSGPYTWVDKVFMHEIALRAQESHDAYEGMAFKAALKSAFYDLQSARNEYRKAVTTMDTTMHHDLVFKYMEVQALVMSPITPHWSDYAWINMLKKEQTILKALWPSQDGIVGNEDGKGVLDAAYFIRNLLSAIRSSEERLAARRAKGKSALSAPSTQRKITIFVASKFPEWHTKVIDILKECYDMQKKAFNGKEMGLVNAAGFNLKKDKKIMPLISATKVLSS